ncbi:MAG: IS110 family transposase [Bacteroidaceae bacterium]|nr:IS110 family transposase [Bacteroidaceae bacterium]
MKNLFIGIDVSKEKLNFCFRNSDAIVYEDETPNIVSNIKKLIKNELKKLNADKEDILICAEYTGRYIYPLVCACRDLEVFLWMEDPTRIKNSFGVTRGKNDTVDARRIAEYSYRFNDKAVAYNVKDKTIASLKELLSNRDQLLSDKVKYQTQLNDQKNYMDKSDYKRKSVLWEKVIETLQKMIDEIEGEMENIIGSDENIKHQMDLLTSIDGVGKKLAINMIVITEGFSRFQNARQFNCYAGLAPFQYTSGKSIHSKSKVSQRANKHIKALLHLCAVSAGTHMLSSEYKDYYERRRAEGKHPMCILNVIRAKIVARMFSVIKRDAPYSKEYKLVS